MSTATMMKHSREDARKAKDALLALLAKTQPRTSVGIGRNTAGSDYALTVAVERPALAKDIPPAINGFEVRVISNEPYAAYRG